MKTQIKHLRSGLKNQFLNPLIDYSNLPKNTSQSNTAHCGTNNFIVSEVWEKVKRENPDFLKIKVFDIEIELFANWSRSKKTVLYSGPIKTCLLNKFNIQETKDGGGFLNISYANNIEIRNTKNDYKNICPSLIDIL